MDEATTVSNGFAANAVAGDPTGRIRAAANFRLPNASASNRSDRTVAGRIGAQPAEGRRKLGIGQLAIELRTFAEQTAVDLRVSSTRVLLVLPLRGSVEIIATGDPRLSCEPGAPALLARAEVVTAVWRRSSLGAFVYFPRSALQVAASERLGDARRLAGVNMTAGRVSLSDPLEEIVDRLADLARKPLPDADAKPLESTFYHALVERFGSEDEALEIFPRSRTVNEAMQLVRADHAKPWDANRLAAVVGVTAPTLRKNFKSSLGVAVTDFICTVRLDWAHERLSSALDSRPIADLSRAAGFSGATTFTRAYLRRFAEAPSQTRARAVRTMG